MARKLDYVILFDIYGKLLTDIQYDTLDLCYNEDLSLAEIAEAQGGKTRQSVVYTINKSQQKLAEYEEKLGIAKRLRTVSDEIEKLKAVVNEMKQSFPENKVKEIDEALMNIENEL